MNRFFNETGYGKNFSTFDEHIAYLENKIKEEETWIAESKTSIEEYNKEIEEVVAAKLAAEDNPLVHEPTIWLGGWEDTDDKKQEVYEWCQAHELRYHPEVVGNYFKEERKTSEKRKPNYEFITATSHTSKIRYVRCVDCYQKWIKEGKPEPKEPDSYERYLKN
jgi:hypothetical protein